MAMPTPSAAIWSIASRASPAPSTITPSVTSSSTSVGSTPVSWMRRRRRSTNDERDSWFAETLTAMRSGRPSACHARAWRSASRSTHSPIGTISPVSSAMGMNSTGEMVPRSP